MKRPVRHALGQRDKGLDDMTEPELNRALTAGAEAVQAAMPPGTSFILIAFDRSNIGQYVATVDRSCCVAMLREVATRIELRETVERKEFPDAHPA